jgi:serine/threonine protein kinase/tetratricopeptide (TPR) repeat protein
MPDQRPSEKSVFLEAVEITSAAERAAFLDRACGDNLPLRAEVEALLRAHAAPQRVLDAPQAVTPTSAEALPLECPGAVIGPYKLLEQIGEGGMGTVYLAQQTEPVRRLVALKVIKPGMDSRQVIARFEAERQALALMDHPNIARVFEAGTTDRGHPYFVMELVKGVPITNYCDEHKLPPRARLELFVQVCQAVQHAHQKGIIHRDLKPSNVLVASYDGVPVPKVIDFGIAKATGRQLTDRTLVTGFGTVVGTLEYMSPEQAELNQLDIDTRSDIYSLGVLLYELLTGTTPLEPKRLKEAAFLEVLRVIREEEPPRPSTRLGTTRELPAIAASRGLHPKKLSGLVRGELDWIVMKALEKDRNRRYETANGLGRDLQRYLADEPVQAGPPSAWYRFRKFARRNKRPLVMATGVLVALLVMMIDLALSMRRSKAEQERTGAALVRAERNLDRAEEVVNKMLMKVGHDLERAPRMTMTQKGLYEEALVYYQEFLKERSGDRALRYKAGAAGFQVGRIYQLLGRPVEAENAYAQALALLGELVAEYPTVPEYRQRLALSHHNLGVLRHKAGRHREAEQAVRQALALDEQLVADFPAVPEYRKDLAVSYLNLGNIVKQPREKEQAYRRALALQEKLVEDFPAESDCGLDLAMTHHNLASLLWKNDRARHEEAEQAYRHSIRILQKLTDPRRAQYWQELGTFHRNLGVLLASTGRPKEAESESRRALGIHKTTAVNFPDLIGCRVELADSHRVLGNILEASRRIQEAEQEYRQALVVAARLADDYPGTPEYQRDVAYCQTELGAVLARTGRHKEAEPILRQCLGQFENLAAGPDPHPKDVVSAGVGYGNLGSLLSNDGRPAEALDWFAKAIRTLEPLVNGKEESAAARKGLVTVHISRAQSFFKLNRPAEALADWARVGALGEKIDDLNYRTAQVLCRLKTEAGYHARAVEEMIALAAAKDAGPDQIYNAACVCALAAAAQQDGQLAEQYAARAVQLLRRAVTQGFLNFEHMKKDPDLVLLRARADFKDLLAPRPPVLRAPSAGATLPNGSLPDAAVRKDYVWEFEWSEVLGASRYHLQVFGARATIPVLDATMLTVPSYRLMGKNSYIADQNRLGWRWKVRALVGGVWTEWSEERVFHVEKLTAEPAKPGDR